VNNTKDAALPRLISTKKLHTPPCTHPRSRKCHGRRDRGRRSTQTPFKGTKKAYNATRQTETPRMQPSKERRKPTTRLRQTQRCPRHPTGTKKRPQRDADKLETPLTLPPTAPRSRAQDSHARRAAEKWKARPTNRPKSEDISSNLTVAVTQENDCIFSFRDYIPGTINKTRSPVRGDWRPHLILWMFFFF